MTTDYRILCAIGGAGKITAKAIAEHIYIHVRYVQRRLKIMCEDDTLGYVDKSFPNGWCRFYFIKQQERDYNA